MSWFRCESGLAHHPKINKLARRLGVSLPEARGYILALFCDTMANHPDGDLSTCDAESIAIAADWGGDEAAFASELEAVGFLDATESGWAIHDWQEYAEGYKAAKKQKRYRDRKKAEAAGDVTLRNGDVTRDVTLRNGDVTLPISNVRTYQTNKQTNEDHQPRQSDEIATVAEFETACAGEGWSISLSGTDIGKAKALIDAGPIQAHEWRLAVETVNGRRVKRKPAYALGVIAGERNAEAEARAGPQNGPTTDAQAEQDKNYAELMAWYEEVKNGGNGENTAPQDTTGD